jgi:hypothetical protein
VPIVLKSGSLNLLEPSGPVQACNGIALPFTYYTNWLNNLIYLVKSIFIDQLKENRQGQQYVWAWILKPSHLCELEMDSVLTQRICHLAVFMIFQNNWPTASKIFLIYLWQLNFCRYGSGINTSGQAPQWPLHLDHSPSFMQPFVQQFYTFMLLWKCNTLVTYMSARSLGFKKLCPRCLNLMPPVPHSHKECEAISSAYLHVSYLGPWAPV